MHLFSALHIGIHIPCALRVDHQCPNCIPPVLRISGASGSASFAQLPLFCLNHYKHRKNRLVQIDVAQDLPCLAALDISVGHHAASAKRRLRTAAKRRSISAPRRSNMKLGTYSLLSSAAGQRCPSGRSIMSIFSVYRTNYTVEGKGPIGI